MLTRGHEGIEGALRLQRVDDAYRAIVVDRAGEQVRSVPAVKRPAKAHIPLPLLETGLVLHERATRAHRRIAEHRRYVAMMVRWRSVLRHHFDTRLARASVLSGIGIPVDHDPFDGLRWKVQAVHFLAVQYDRRLPDSGREKTRKKRGDAVAPDRHRHAFQEVVINGDRVGVLLDIFSLRQRAFTFRDLDSLGDVDLELQLQRLRSIGADREAALERLESW